MIKLLTRNFIVSNSVLKCFHKISGIVITPQGEINIYLKITSHVNKWGNIKHSENKK